MRWPIISFVALILSMSVLDSIGSFRTISVQSSNSWYRMSINLCIADVKENTVVGKQHNFIMDRFPIKTDKKVKEGVRPNLII